MEIRVHIIPKAFYSWRVCFKIFTIIIIRSEVFSIKKPCLFRDLKALLHILVFTFQFLGLMIFIWEEGWLSEHESSNFLLVWQKKKHLLLVELLEPELWFSLKNRDVSPSLIQNPKTLAGSYLTNKRFSEEWSNSDSFVQWCLFLYLLSLVTIQPCFAGLFFFPL